MTEPTSDPGVLHVVAERSAVLIEARSNVGPISFGTTGLRGFALAEVRDSALDFGPSPVATLTIDMTSLASGNGLYDAELARRIDTRRFPISTLQLREVTPLGERGRHQAVGTLTLHGVTRSLTGTVAVSAADGDELLVQAEHVLDIRDFDIPAPTVLMLRIYPDVRVQLHLCVAPAAVEPDARV